MPKAFGHTLSLVCLELKEIAHSHWSPSASSGSASMFLELSSSTERFAYGFMFGGGCQRECKDV